MKKKLAAMVLICALAASVCACGSTGGTGSSSKQEENLAEAETMSVDKIGDDVDEIMIHIYDNPADGTYISYYLYADNNDSSVYHIMKMEGTCEGGYASGNSDDYPTTIIDTDTDTAKELAAYFDENVADQFPAESKDWFGLGDDAVYKDIYIQVVYKDSVHETVTGTIMENEKTPDWVDGFVALFEEKMANETE